MALLQVEGLDEHPALRLSLDDARDLGGRRIAIVGYPLSTHAILPPFSTTCSTVDTA
jgi:hypothetical protein